MLNEIEGLNIVYQDEFITLIQGDVRDVLPLLPEGIVQSCITSPPYFGLRDYGTAVWEGGDAECDHSARRSDTVSKSKASSTLGGSTDTVHLSHNFKDICLKCGARRIDSQIGLERTPACEHRGLMRLRPDLSRDELLFVASRLLGVDFHGDENDDTCDKA